MLVTLFLGQVGCGALGSASRPGSPLSPDTGREDRPQLVAPDLALERGLALMKAGAYRQAVPWLDSAWERRGRREAGEALANSYCALRQRALARATYNNVRMQAARPDTMPLDTFCPEPPLYARPWPWLLGVGALASGGLALTLGLLLRSTTDLPPLSFTGPR